MSKVNLSGMSSGDARRIASLVEHVPLATLRANSRNARTHSKAQIRKIAQSIERFGFLNPVLVDEDGLVLAGHGRIEAARLIGLATAPTLRFSHLSDAEKRAYVIADNRIAEQAGWDRETLAIEHGELSDLLPAEGIDITSTGFEVAEIDLLLADMASAKPEPGDTIPAAPRNPTTRSGDLWRLGRHKLLCGDARSLACFDRLMQGDRAAAVFCDPPYNLAVRSIGGRGRVKHAEFACASGEMSQAQFRTFLKRTLANGARVSRPGALHYACIDWRHVADMVEAGGKVFNALLNIAVWVKTNGGQGSFYRSQHEFIAVFQTQGGAHRNNIELGRYGRNRTNVWTHPGVNTFAKGRKEDLEAHPTVKPVNLVADALLDCTARGDIVLDQFSGSGTIFLAAEKVGRTARGIEWEPKYVDVAIRRWQATTKLEATLEGDGRTFDEIAAERKTTPDDAESQDGGRPTRRRGANEKRGGGRG